MAEELHISFDKDKRFWFP